MKNFQPALRIAEDEEAFARDAASSLIEALQEADNPLITLPAGRTPLPLYRVLVKDPAGHNVWKKVRYLALDDYAGLPDNDPRSFYEWLRREALDPLGIPQQQRQKFHSAAPDPAREATRIETWLEENGPLDVAVLGLGNNGHLAFNEPGAAFDSITRVVTLAPESLLHNAGYWGGEDKVPRRAFTLGLKAIMDARRVILLVTGAHKKEILGKVLHDPVGTDIPATCLRLRDNVTVIADRAAYGL